MAVKIGRIHRLKVTSPPILAWVYIGPAANDTDLLVIIQPDDLGPEEAAYRASMVDALGTALISQHEVRATHADDGIGITMVELRS